MGATSKTKDPPDSISEGSPVAIMVPNIPGLQLLHSVDSLPSKHYSGTIAFDSKG